MLWNADMIFPYVELAEQLKAKEAKKASNPFTAVAKRKQKEKKIDQQSAKDDATVQWNPVIQENSIPRSDNSVSLAPQDGRMGGA